MLPQVPTSQLTTSSIVVGSAAVLGWDGLWVSPYRSVFELAYKVRLKPDATWEKVRLKPDTT
jgi:hypothetical protein